MTFVKGGAAAALRQLEERRIEGEREREGDAVARTHLRTQTRAKRVNI